MTKILIADDELELQDLLKFTFEHAGYEVYQVYDGKAAIEKIKEIYPDLIILDIIMPEINGFEVVEKIRIDPEVCTIPIIMLTSMSHPRDKLTGLKLGADEYLVKPVNPYELLNRANSLFKKYSENVNLLTRLPTENLFERDAKNLIEESKEFRIVYIDICEFKSFNLSYGFKKGDELLKLFSTIIRITVANFGSNKDTFYHIYENSFAILTYLEKNQLNLMIENIITLYKEFIIYKTFDIENLKKGFFEYHLPDGQKSKASLLPVAVVVIEVYKNRFSNIKEFLTYLTDILEIAKQKCKEKSESVVVWG